MVESYYNKLAPYYKFLHDNWETSVVKESIQLDSVIHEFFGSTTRNILDVACGIGTQCLGLAQLGYKVVASDISVDELEIARNEAIQRNLNIEFRIGDMRKLQEVHKKQFDVIIACDNAIPHLLDDAEIKAVFENFYQQLNANGGCIISVRDYEKMEKNGKRLYPRTIHETSQGDVLLFDLWEFEENHYNMTTYIVVDKKSHVDTHVIRGGRYYCVSIEKLEKLLKQAGFYQITVLREHYFQPLIIAVKTDFN